MDTVFEHWPTIVNLLAGSLLGAWMDAGWATKLKNQTLYCLIAVLLVGGRRNLPLGIGQAADRSQSWAVAAVAGLSGSDWPR